VNKESERKREEESENKEKGQTKGSDEEPDLDLWIDKNGRKPLLSDVNVDEAAFRGLIFNQFLLGI